MKPVATYGSILLLLVAPHAAFGFSDHDLYDAPALDGGGGSRYFTGSRTDGYDCSVCHGSSATADFSIEGIPRTLVAGQRYDLTIRWAEPDVRHGLHVELANPDGTHPSVTTLAEAMLPAESRCGRTSTGVPAVYVLDRGVRRIVGVEPCGASQVSLGFVAGAQPIELTIAGVRGNQDDTPSGDQTFLRRFVLGEQVTEPSTGCAVGGRGSAWLALALSAVIARRRTRR